MAAVAVDVDGASCDHSDDEEADSVVGIEAGDEGLCCSGCGGRT